MSKDKPKSLGELKVGHVYPLGTLLKEVMTGKIHQYEGFKAFAKDDSTVVFFERMEGCALKVTAIYDRREEVKPKSKSKCNVFNVYPGKKEFN